MNFHARARYAFFEKCYCRTYYLMNKTFKEIRRPYFPILIQLNKKMHPLYTKSSYPVQTRSSMDCEVHSEDEKKKGRLYCNLFLGSTCTIGRFGYSDPKNLSIHNYLFHIGRVITLRELCVLLRKPLGEHTKPKCRLATK